VDRGDERPPNLAPAYQLALDLEAAGVEGNELAERLGVPLESLPSLLAVAHAKAVHTRATGVDETPTA
jgi:hypothetical protein